ncbi:hypothetical protein [Ureibacillus manganicus]|uniref:Uncharacterized protein n=1 Tax=Ureibacillus manganicus DSM 26584 TaxID=1384049 RepID=A0A0A3INI7_9BACL|nr:hypothetical protein [Ureibacillus manganicus]KGR76402.1 hypothetical protein CD29_16875 [Ureibacillus manganicus DSM 26584]
MDQQTKPKKKKKRIWLYILSGLLVIILGFAGYVLYEFKIKQYDVADPVVDEIIEENYVIDLPDGNKMIIDKEGNIVEEKGTTETVAEESDTETSTQTETDTESSTGRDQATNNNNNSGTPATSKPKPEKPTVASIKQKYMPAIQALESQANTKINGLVQQAKNEYVAKKSNGESISFGYFYNKYLGAADALEQSTDAAFNSIISVVENELVNNGFSKDHVNSLRTEYEATKEARRSNLYNKALEML